MLNMFDLEEVVLEVWFVLSDSQFSGQYYQCIDDYCQLVVGQYFMLVFMSDYLWQNVYYWYCQCQEVFGYYFYFVGDVQQYVVQYFVVVVVCLCCVLEVVYCQCQLQGDYWVQYCIGVNCIYQYCGEEDNW